MASRVSNDTRVPVDNFWIETVRFSVSGSGTGDMTGSLITATNMNVQITYPSGTVPGYNFSVPSGSFLITLPGGGSPGGPVNGRYSRIYNWNASMEAQGTDITMNPLATINSFQLIQYGHSAVSGTFLGGFVRMSGSTTNGGSLVAKGTVPADPMNPASPAAQVYVSFFGRNSVRPV